MGSPAGRLKRALHPDVAFGAGFALDEDMGRSLRWVARVWTATL